LKGFFKVFREKLRALKSKEAYKILLAYMAVIASYASPCNIINKLNANIGYIIIGSGVSKSLTSYCKKSLTIYISLPILLWMFGYIYLGFKASLGINERILLSSVFALIGYFISIFVSYVIPVFRYSSRKDMLEAKFHIFASSLTSFLAGGGGLASSLKTFSEKYASELKEFSVEMDYIKTMSDLNVDPVTILYELSKITPSPSLKILSQSLARGERVGTDLVRIAQDSIDTYLNFYYSLVEKISTSIGTLLESFLVVSVIGPVLVGVMGMLFGVVPVTKLSFSSLVLMVNFLLIPIVSLITAVLADNQASKLKL